MGRMDQAIRRARQSGVVTGFGPLPGIPDDVAVLAAEPFPDEFAPKPAAPNSSRTLVSPQEGSLSAAIAATPKRLFQEPAASNPPKIDVLSHDDDREIKEIFFNTYFEKVWSGPH